MAQEQEVVGYIINNQTLLFSEDTETLIQLFTKQQAIEMSYQQFHQGGKKPGAAPYPQQQYYPPPQSGGAPYPSITSHPPNSNPHHPNNPYPSYNIGFSSNIPMQMPQPLNIPVYPPSAPPASGGYPPLSSGGYPPPPSSGGYPPQSSYPPPRSSGSYLPTKSSGCYPPPQQSSGCYPPPQSSGGYPPNSNGGYPPPQSCGGYPTPHSNGGYPPPPSGASYPPPSRPALGAPPGGRGYEGHKESYTGYGGSHQTTYTPPKRTPTVRPVHPFNPRQDAEALRAAMKGWGCDDKALVNILAYRSNAQRLQIEKDYKVLFGRDLKEDLISETKGNLETLLVALITPLPVYYAKELHHAIDGIGTNENVLIEILCTKSNAEIMTIRNAYHALYKTSLENDLKGDTSGYFKRLMVSLCNAARDESMVTNPAAAQRDAEDLKRAGVDRFGTDETTFNMVLCQRNWAQLQLVFQEYQKIAGHDIEEAIKNEFSGDIERGLLAVIRSIKNQAAFFAKLLNESMKGLGTKDRTLIRLVVTRSEIDMVEIKREYEARYGETLAQAIEGDTSGNYKKCLLALIGEGKH